MDNKIVTLRIKKVYFDLIKNGIKTKEYRNYNDFYKKIFEKNPQYLKLHYQKKENLIMKIKKIEIIKTPKEIKEIKGIIFLNKVYKISLEHIINL